MIAAVPRMLATEMRYAHVVWKNDSVDRSSMSKCCAEKCRRACLMRSGTSLPAAPKVSNRRGRTDMLRLASMIPASLQSALKLSDLEFLNFSPASAA